MSEAVNLKRARIVEFTSGPRMTAVRTKRGDPFRIVALDGNPDPATVLPNDWDETGVECYGKDVNVLAEFPVTLADLIPEGCTEFRFKSNGGVQYVAGADSDGDWLVTRTEGWFELHELAYRFDIDLTTVVPLAVDPQYVEERR